MADPVSLYPPPRSTRVGSDHLNRADRHYVVFPPGASDPLIDTVMRFCELHDLAPTAKAPESAVLATLQTARLAAQHYQIDITQDGITIRGGDDAGLAYGLATLSQLLISHGTFLPCLTIEDGPDFKHRGVMLDISRCKVPTLDTLKSLIDVLADLKYNQVQLYTEHTFAFSEHPLVWADASPLTPADILALRRYCASRFIDLVPNLNSFGHFERWLRYPEYHDIAECPDGFTHPLTGGFVEIGSTLHPSRASLALLRSLYDEYLPLFESRFFNVGGDEPWELGEGRSRKRCEKEGKTNVYIDFLAKIQVEAEKRGRQMMFWSDIVLKEPASLKRLSRDLIALNWGYEANHPFRTECEQVARQRIPFYVCPGTSSWNSLTSRIANARGNLARAAKEGHAHGAEGYLVTDWGDHGHHQYLPISYPGFLMGACNAWNVRRGKNIDVADGLARFFFGDLATAEWLLDLGDAESMVHTPIRNATLFNRLLFWRREHAPKVAAKVTTEALYGCLDHLGELRERLTELDPAVEADLLLAEFRNAGDLAAHGLRRLIEFRGDGFSATGLREELRPLIGRHEQLWLARNRPGGLRESTGHLHRALDAI